MKRAPAIPLFGDAYIADTRHLSLEEHGAYLQLLMIAWRTPDCALPNDDARLAQMLSITRKKWATIKPQVMAFWTLSEAGWQQKRLLKERRWVAKKSEDNRSAANARWDANSLENNEVDDANAIPEACKIDAPPPTQEEERKKKEGGADAPSSKYVFEGMTIRLERRHFDQWQADYHSINDLNAELRTLDGWWQDQPEEKRKKWFHPTMGMLNRKHQEILEKRKEAQRDGDKLYV